MRDKRLSRSERIRWRRGRESPRFVRYVLWNLADVTQGVWHQHQVSIPGKYSR